MHMLWSASAGWVALSAGVSHTPETISEDTVERPLDWLDSGPTWPIGNLRDITVGRLSELQPEIGTVPNHEFLTPASCRRNYRAVGRIQFSPVESEVLKTA
jgi:hypothetical protein